MSAGRFARASYETNDGNVVPIRVQPETISASIGATTNAEPATAILSGWPSACVSSGRTSCGINARLVRLQFDDGAAPDGYQEGGTITIPALTPAFFNAASVGQAATYLGSAATIVGRTAETIR